MFDLFEKLFEVATKVNPEKQMQDYYKKVLNTKIKKSIRGIKQYLKFWLLTNGDVVPVTYVHDSTAREAGTTALDLLHVGAFIGAIVNNKLSLNGSIKQEFTTRQISRLKNIYIEYGITNLVVDAGEYFSTDVKSPKELSYYLEYGKEEFESMNTGNLLDKILEASAADIRRKHRSIKRLFPDFDIKTKGVEDKGGLRLVDQDNKTWKFKIHSGTSDIWYDAYLSFKNPKQTLERMVKDRRFWVADKTKVDLRKIAKAFMNKADIQLFCSCPAFKFWGPAFILSLDKYDAQYTRKEIRPPSVRNPKRYGAVCKHLDRLLKVFPFYGSTLAKWIKDFYAKDIAKWEQESQEEFLGGVRKAQAAVTKRREEPEVEEPEKEQPVTVELDKAKLKKEKPEEEPEEKPEKEKPEEPEKKEPEEEEPEEKPKKKKPKKISSEPKKAPKPEWKPDAGEGPEEDYF